MFTFSQLGKKGNLGNQLFQIASTIGLAKSNSDSYGFPNWKFQPYFKNKLPILPESDTEFEISEEKLFEFYNWELSNGNHDISGWLQTEKYFDAKSTKHYFEFNDEIIASIKEKYKEAFTKKTILISIRRGDFVRHQDYFQVPIHYYLNSLARFFPDWQSSNLIVLSDDIDYCKFHFSFLENAYFGDRLNVIEQLCLGSLCDDFIIGNSTFSWWSAWLGEKPDSKIIRPDKNFDGKKSEELNDIDYFPERWTRYNHTNDTITLDGLAISLEFGTNADALKQYISSFFNVGLISFNSVEYPKKYHFKKEYYLPPILIYYSSLLAQQHPDKVVANAVTNVFSVSKNRNFQEFSIDNDFGFFSRIFTFKKTSVKTSEDFYITSNTLKQNNPERIIINCTAGKFSTIGGYSFSLFRSVKKTEITIKSTIKKILSIKKNG